MPLETTKDEVLTALGKKGTVVGTAPTSSLDSTTKILNALDKPIVEKYLDRILGRFIKEAPKENPAGDTVRESGQPASTTRTPAHKPPAPQSGQGAQAVESLQIFVSMQDKEITLGQFSEWIEKNKENLAKAIDKGMVMQKKAATQEGANSGNK